MATRLNSLQLRASHDQTLGDAYNIESFTPTTGSPLQVNVSPIGLVYIWVNGEPDYSQGQRVIDANNGVTYIGYQQVRYTTPQMHIDAFDWLETNYEGEVTAYLRTRGTTYARYNCQLRFESQKSERNNFYEVTWIFTIIEAL